MEDKEAIEILIRLLDEYPLSEKEREAIQTAVGALGWTKLAKGRMQNIIRARKAKREKDIKG